MTTELESDIVALRAEARLRDSILEANRQRIVELEAEVKDLRVRVLEGTRERMKLRALIARAPHGPDCSAFARHGMSVDGAQLAPLRSCNCWKSRGG